MAQGVEQREQVGGEHHAAGSDSQAVAGESANFFLEGIELAKKWRDGDEESASGIGEVEGAADEERCAEFIFELFELAADGGLLDGKWHLSDCGADSLVSSYVVENFQMVDVHGEVSMLVEGGGGQ